MVLNETKQHNKVSKQLAFLSLILYLSLGFMLELRLETRQKPRQETMQKPRQETRLTPAIILFLKLFITSVIVLLSEFILIPVVLLFR